MINDSTLRTDVWNTIRTWLVSTPIYITNSTTGSTTAASIEASYSDKSGRPQVIIVPISVSEDTFKFSGTRGKRLIDVTVECYATSTLYTDQLAEKVEDIVTKAVDSLSGIDLVGITSDYAYCGLTNNKNHLISVTFSFDRE